MDAVIFWNNRNNRFMVNSVQIISSFMVFINNT